MTKRTRMVVGAAVLGLAGVGAAWLISPPAERASLRGPAALDLPDAPGARDLPGSDGAPPRVGAVTGPRYMREQGDRVTVFGADRVHPLADFVYEAERPYAELRYAPDEALVITASRGRFEVPGNDPQRGEFDADTVATLFRAPAGGTLDLDDPAQVVLRVFLDAPTTFDRDLGQLRSDGPVHVTARGFDFRGTGLLALYNVQLERLERLVVDRGEVLRFARSVAGGGDASSSDAAAMGEAVPDSTASAGVADAGVVEATVAEAPAVDAPPAALAGASTVTPPQDRSDDPEALAAILYRADFSDDVFVVAGPDGATMEGDVLSAVFPMGDLDRAESSLTRGRESDAAPGERGARLAQADGAALPLPNVADRRSLMTPADDDVTVTWSGPLVVAPLGEPPAELLASLTMNATLDEAAAPPVPGEGLRWLMMQGTPVRGRGPAGDRFTADRVSYLAEPRRLSAWSAGAAPVVIDTADRAQVVGTRLDTDLDAGRALLRGPGRLVGRPREDAGGQTTDPSIAFTDAAAVWFAPLSQDLDDGGASARIEQAVFVGGVRAAGHDAARDRPAGLDADRLTLAFEPIGEAAPLRALHATGNVRGRHGADTLAAETLHATLSTVADADDGSLAIDTVDAEGGVVVNVNGDPRDEASGASDAPPLLTTLTAPRLQARPAEGLLEMFGADAVPATIDRNGAKLAGEQLTLREGARSLLATGPGTLTAPLAGGDPSAMLRAAWTQRLTYDGLAGTAQLLGEVRAATSSADDDTQLDAHRLDLWFVDEAGVDAAGVDESEPSTPLAPATDEGVQLRRAVAIADPQRPDAVAVLTAQSFDPAATDTPLTRLTIIGRELTFDQDEAASPAVALAAVAGPGQLLFEDNRPPTGDASASVQVQGPGRTFMEWSESLRADATANDLFVNGDVFVNHQPSTDDREPIKLLGQTLTADLTSTGGLGAWMSGGAPDPTLREAVMRGNVVTTHPRLRVESDELRYRDASKQITFTADRGQRVTATSADGRAMTPAERFTWDLVRDRLTATGTSGGVVPME